MILTSPSIYFFSFHKPTSVIFLVYDFTCKTRHTFEKRLSNSAPFCNIYFVETSTTLNSWRETREAVIRSGGGTQDDLVSFQQAELLMFFYPLSEFKLQPFLFDFTHSIWLILLFFISCTGSRWLAVVALQSKEALLAELQVQKMRNYVAISTFGSLKINWQTVWLSSPQAHELLFLPSIKKHLLPSGWLVVHSISCWGP